MTKLFTGLLLASILLSCGDSAPKGILSKEKMTTVLWDYMEANVYSFEQMKDSLQEDTVVNAKMQLSVFEKHKVSRESFEASYNYYAGNATEFKEIIDSVIARKQRTDTTLNIKKGFMPMQGL